jgi:hypothetical protein
MKQVRLCPFPQQLVNIPKLSTLIQSSNPKLSIKIYFNIILPSTLDVYQVFFLLQIFRQKLWMHFFPPVQRIHCLYMSWSLAALCLEDANTCPAATARPASLLANNTVSVCCFQHAYFCFVWITTDWPHSAYSIRTTQHSAYSIRTTQHSAYSIRTTQHSAYSIRTTQHSAYSIRTTQQSATSTRYLIK